MKRIIIGILCVVSGVSLSDVIRRNGIDDAKRIVELTTGGGMVSANSNDRMPGGVEWKQIYIGASTSTVIELIGPPKSIIDMGLVSIWNYGVVVSQSLVFPLPYEFSIMVAGGGVVFKEDPYNGRFSTNGLPVVPRLIAPLDGSSFVHRPRLVDIRWQPSSGCLPVDYEIEVKGSFHGIVKQPFLSINVMRDGETSWRVRALNSKGTSEWTEARTFNFRDEEASGTHAAGK